MINVIKINLNRASSREARLETRREQLRWVTFGFTVLLLAVTFGYLMYENAQFNEIIETKIMQTREIQKQIASFQKEGKNLAKEDILEMSNLNDMRVLWAQKLNSLGRLIPHDMAITHLVSKDGYLDIAGVSRIYMDEREFDIIEEFIDRLRKDATFAEDFSEIKFSKFSRLTILNQEVVNFEIRAILKPRHYGSPKARS
jgi:Tfp pilus assembly protein PilN